MMLVTKYQISAINSYWEKCDEKYLGGHKLHIGTPYRGKRFWTHQIPTSCLPTLLLFIHIEHIQIPPSVSTIKHSGRTQSFVGRRIYKTYLYFPYHCISLIYFSFTKIRMFLYAQIYWLAEFGDVPCLQFNYLRVETLIPTWEDLVRYLSDNFKSEDNNIHE
jgi:hypothetical protein